MKNPTGKRPAFPGRSPKMKNLSDERGVSPVIAVILMVAITVVLASVLYVMVIDIIGGGNEKPITGAMEFDETDPGVYIGRIVSISDTVSYTKISITITDVNTGNAASLNPLSNGGTASCGEEQLSITYRDVNENGQLDGGDIFTIHNGEEGDMIVLTQKNGNPICEVKLM